jgi:hypothetical protein
MAVTTGWMSKLKKILAGSGQKALSKVEVRYDAGFGNTLFIRGKGAGLSWEKGVVLKNLSPDVWIWETDRPFESCTFKLLLNDAQYETGENRTLQFGGTVHYTPRF